VLTQELFSRFPDQIDPDPVSGKVYSFTATPSLMDSGQVSILDWKTALGTSATLNGGPVAIHGTMAVAPTVTTPYTLIARGSIVDTTTVTLAIYQTGKIISFSASQTFIGAGDQVVLRWNAAHGSAVTLNDSSVRRTDSVIVHPLKTTTYRLIGAGTVRDTSAILITAVPLDQINRALRKSVSVSSNSRTPALANPQSLSTAIPQRSGEAAPATVSGSTATWDRISSSKKSLSDGGTTTRQRGGSNSLPMTTPGLTCARRREDREGRR